MYESYYGFREKPFSLLPDPDFFYKSSIHAAALNVLAYGLFNRSGFVVITGEIGTGKSLLLRKMIVEAGRELTVGMISNTHAQVQSLMPWIPPVFKLRSKSQDPVVAYRHFSDFLEREQAEKRRVVLAVDEAQNLTPAMLEELRLLSNLNSGKDPVLQIVLSGQPGLRDLLRRPDMVQFAQRIDAEYHLEPMNAEETTQYIRHRLKTAGGEFPLFEDAVFPLIYRLTGGIPRLINQVCERSLVYGFAESARNISARVVAEAASDRVAGGIVPFDENVDLTPYLRERETKIGVHGANGNGSHREERHRPAGGSGEVPDSAYRKGMELRQDGQYDEAIRFFEKAAQAPGYWLKAHFQAGLCHRDAGRIEEGLRSFRTALSDHSAPDRETVRVRYETALALEIRGKFREAADVYRRIQLMDPGHGDVDDRLKRITASFALRRPWIGRIRGRLIRLGPLRLVRSFKRVYRNLIDS
ncbi:MAG TPA: AAA family ATPase [Nitrospiria bacterium]|jgi:type II secretory pathway predicted ATPase ExeA|nr:AAA family ATPase [Nitrospiria bacterium]